MSIRPTCYNSIRVQILRPERVDAHLRELHKNCCCSVGDLADFRNFQCSHRSVQWAEFVGVDIPLGKAECETVRHLVHKGRRTSLHWHSGRVLDHETKRFQELYPNATMALARQSRQQWRARSRHETGRARRLAEVL